MRVLVQTKNRAILTVVALLVCIGLLDYVSGTRLDLFALHVLPVAIAAWYLDSSAVLLVVGLASLIWFFDDATKGSPGVSDMIPYWDAVVRLLSMAIVGLLLSKLHRTLVEERAAKQALAEALAEIQQLKGFLSICAGCKSIRHEDGSWEQVESYIRQRAPVEFSHGLCPDCVRRLYPDLYDDDEALT